jgi:hypothetical protein
MRQKDRDKIHEWDADARVSSVITAKKYTADAIEQHSKDAPHMKSVFCPKCAAQRPIVDIDSYHKSLGILPDVHQYRCLGCLGLFYWQSAQLVPVEQPKPEAKKGAK